MKLLLDTNAYSALKRGHEATAALLRRAERVFLSAIVAGELAYGFRCGRHLDRNLKDLGAFLDNPYVSFLPVTRTTTDRYSRVAAILRRKGKPIPTNDIWIAAQALEVGADLVSFDEHFGAVDGLVWVHPSRS